MRKLFKSFKNNAGFTLIELLVVIGILGILAAALIATIDPFEQLNKAQDANAKNTLVEFIDANIRYYTTHSALPWNDTANANSSGCVANAASILAGGMTLSDPAMTSNAGCINALIGDGELKSSFTTAANILGKIYVKGSDTDVTACFAPISKGQRNASDTTWNQNGDASQNGCPNATSGSCYWCSK